MKNCIERTLFECEKEQQHHHHQSNTKEKNSFGVCTKVLNTKKGTTTSNTIKLTSDKEGKKQTDSRLTQRTKNEVLAGI